MPNLILNQKVKYKGKSYPVSKKGVTEPIPVASKDVKFFESNNMIVDVIDKKGKKLYLDKRDKEIEGLESELDKLKAQLAKKDEIITDLEVQVEELKTGEVGKGDNELDKIMEPGEQQKENTPEEKKLEDKTVEELYEVAQELDISGRSKIRNDKSKLIEAIVGRNGD